MFRKMKNESDNVETVETPASIGGAAHDLEHELPPADPNDGFEAAGAADVAATKTEPSAAEKLRAERDTLLDRLARLQAEFDNYRKRAAKEQSDYRDFALTDALRSLLPVLDNFDLALKANASDKDVRSGVELIRRQFEDILTRLGAQPVPAIGEPFDPRFHEAIEMVETDEVPDNQIVDELRRGYRIKDRLLRPAMVRVARNHRK